ncbi:hypothetical protein KKC91_06310 [bacterium]|nr:hypothetical protein [bacterium]
MLEREYKYYQNNKDSIIKKYKNQFVVIKDSKIIGAYSSREEALKESVKEYKLGEFLIQEVSDKKNEQIQRFYSRVYV